MSHSGTESLRILHVTATLGLGGAEQMLLNLIGQQLQDGHRVAVAVLREPSPTRSDLQVWRGRENDLRSRGVEVLPLVHGRAGFVSARRALAAQEGRFDIVHAHFLLGATSAGLGLRAPVVWTMHSTSMGVPRASVVLTRPLVDRFIGCSPNVTEAFKPWLGSRVETVVNGIDTARFPVHLRSGVKAGPLHLVAVGGLRPPKNYPRMVEAFGLAAARLREAGYEPELTIVGGGGQQSVIENAIRDAGVDGPVRLAGAQSDVGPYLEQADIYLMSSDWEGLPIALLEAMASGLPVITTPIPVAKALLESGRDAVLARTMDAQSLADALVELATDPDRQAQLSAAAVQRAAAFDISTCAEQYERVYRSCLS